MYDGWRHTLCNDGWRHTPSIAFRHLHPRKDVVNECLEFGMELSRPDRRDQGQWFKGMANFGHDITAAASASYNVM